MATPSAENCRLGKGAVYVAIYDNTTGVKGASRHLGNVSAMSTSVTSESREIKSFLTGVGATYKKVNVGKKLNVTMTLTEWDKDNLALALYGTTTTGTPPSGSGTKNVVNLLANSKQEVEIIFYDAAPAGPKYDLYLWRVALEPTGEIELLGDDFTSFELTGEVIDDSAAHSTSPFGAFYSQSNVS